MMIGPKVTIEKSCYDYECKKVEHYAVQGDSGCYVSCAHPVVERLVGNDNWRTPDWCPAEVGEASSEVERLRGAIALAYGYLWHVNNEPLAPVPLYSPERAAIDARLALRDLLTNEQRGTAINRVQSILSNADAAPNAGIHRAAEGRPVE